MIKSEVVELEPIILDIIIWGEVGSNVPRDSNTPCTRTMSGTFKHIWSSCTLVPYGKFPKIRPSFKVVVPIPEVFSVDLSITIEETLDLFFIFDFICDFLKVAINLAPVSFTTFNPTICKFLPSGEILNLSNDNGSIVPLDLVNEYLSSS